MENGKRMSKRTIAAVARWAQLSLGPALGRYSAPALRGRRERPASTTTAARRYGGVRRDHHLAHARYGHRPRPLASHSTDASALGQHADRSIKPTEEIRLRRREGTQQRQQGDGRDESDVDHERRVPR